MTALPQLAGLKVVVDTQHLFRTDHPTDRGTIYTLADGTHVAEADAALAYSAALVGALRSFGAQVLTNDPHAGILIGTYPQRNRVAAAWGAQIYLACHVNAGRGSYALAEAMGYSELSTSLASRVMMTVAQNVPEVLTFTWHSLRIGDRGSVCIDRFPADGAAVILEPFFGDTPGMQRLFRADRLADLGRRLALGVGGWWLYRGRPFAITA
jgi:N-acetylmuramoyl-L-alanine amidase